MYVPGTYMVIVPGEYTPIHDIHDNGTLQQVLPVATQDIML